MRPREKEKGKAGLCVRASSLVALPFVATMILLKCESSRSGHSVRWLAALSPLFISAADSYTRRMRTAPNNESLEPAYPPIGEAGVNVEVSGYTWDSIWLIVGYHVSGLISTHCAPTFINPEFHNPIFYPTTQAARGKQNTNHSRNVCIGFREKGPSRFTDYL